MRVDLLMFKFLAAFEHRDKISNLMRLEDQIGDSTTLDLDINKPKLTATSLDTALS